jgi:hypothetical protein
MIRFVKPSYSNSYKLESLNKLTITGNMNGNDLKQSIADGWYFFIDIVGSSDPNLSISRQLEKINQLKI